MMRPALFRRLSEHKSVGARSFLAAVRRCQADVLGIAALEFAASAPILLLIFGAVIDLSVAIWDHLTTVAAVQAGADYAVWYVQSTSPTASTVGTILTNVGRVVSATSRGDAQLSTSNIVVTWNNATDNSNFGSCYCLPASGTWPSAASTCGSTCPDGSTPGSYIQIRATYAYSPMSPADAPFLSGNYTDSVWVRVQ